MSERARRRLNAARRLADLIPSALSAFSGDRRPKSDTLVTRYTRVLETPAALVISAEFRCGAAPPAGTAGLLPLHLSLLRRLARLAQVSARLRRFHRPGDVSAGSRLVEQVDLERQRLGRELHTGVGQALAAIRLQLELLAVQMPSPPPAVQASLEHVAALVTAALGQVRTLSHRLHPPEWQRLGLLDALTQLWEISGIPEKFDASLALQPPPAEPPLAVKVLLYRTVQEALSNLIRHSEASATRMTLESTARRIRITVEDNGKGFDLDRILHGTVSLRAGIGLRTIREQVQALEGDFHVSSGPAGTVLEVSLPLQHEE